MEVQRRDTQQAVTKPRGCRLQLTASMLIIRMRKTLLVLAVLGPGWIGYTGRCMH